jgi:hypothetical protein
MKVLFIFAGLTIWLVACTNHKALDLSKQLKPVFVNHLRNVDSSASIDSLQITRMMPADEKLGRIFDDSIYRREYYMVMAQLRGAQSRKVADSIKFYQYEINYMSKQVDSMAKSIDEGDTTRRFGYVIACYYWISKKNRKKMDSLFLFVDNRMILRNTEVLDSFMRRSLMSMAATPAL